MIRPSLTDSISFTWTIYLWLLSPLQSQSLTYIHTARVHTHVRSHIHTFRICPYRTVHAMFWFNVFAAVSIGISCCFCSRHALFDVWACMGVSERVCGSGWSRIHELVRYYSVALVCGKPFDCMGSACMGYSVMEHKWTLALQACQLGNYKTLYKVVYVIWFISPFFNFLKRFFDFCWFLALFRPYF